MRILLSNDDGYFAPGLAVLAEAVRQIAHIDVVAPERDRSGASNSLTLDRPLSVKRAPNGYYQVNGTPTDCVHLAVTGMLDESLMDGDEQLFQSLWKTYFKAICIKERLNPRKHTQDMPVRYWKYLPEKQQ